MTMLEEPTLGAVIADIAADRICLQHNIRTELDIDDDFAYSIKEQGILVRCTVQPGPCEHGLDYVMAAGHRRTTAAVMAQGPQAPIPCEIVEQGEAERVIYMLTENLQRHDMDPVDEGLAFLQLTQLGMTQALVAASVGKSDAYVSERVAITGLPEQAHTFLRAKRMTLEQAVQLARLNNDVVVDKVLKNVAKGGAIDKWTIEHAEREVRVAKECDAKVAQLKERGWQVSRSVPKNPGKLVKQVKLKGDLGYLHSAIELNLTAAQFMKRTDAHAVVRAQWDGAHVEYYTDDAGLYEKVGEDTDNQDDPVDAALATPRNNTYAEAHRRANEVKEHRAEFLKGLLKSKVAAADINRVYLTVATREAIDNEYDILAEMLDLDDTAGDEEITNAIVRLKAADRFKLLLAAALIREIRFGGRGEYIPDELIALGYAPSEHETGWPSRSDFYARGDDEDGDADSQGAEDGPELDDDEYVDEMSGAEAIAEADAGAHD